MTAEYPTREAVFAMRFQRELIRRGAAQEVGSDGCWLLTVIVAQEDALRYERPVNFHNGQLMIQTGFGSENRLDRVRQRLVDAGYLHYTPGAKRRPGVYWVLIPGEQEAEIPRQNGGESSGEGEGKTPIPLHFGGQNDGETPSIPLQNGGASNLPLHFDPGFTSKMEEHSEADHDSPPDSPPFRRSERRPSIPIPNPNTNTNSPSSSSSIEALTAELRSCGVNRAAETVRASIANGMPVDRLMAIIEHWRKYPDRWTAGILVDRIRREDVSLLPHEGWFDTPEWQKAKTPLERGKAERLSIESLEKRFGKELDRMTFEQLRQLGQRCGDRDVRQCVRSELNAESDPRRHADMRVALLNHLSLCHPMPVAIA